MLKAYRCAFHKTESADAFEVKFIAEEQEVLEKIKCNSEEYDLTVISDDQEVIKALIEKAEKDGMLQ